MEYLVLLLDYYYNFLGIDLTSTNHNIGTKNKTM